MADLAGLSNAHAILLATKLCATGDVAGLPQLQAQFPSALPLERLLRIILTFLPESIEPQRYTSVVRDLVDGGRVETPPTEIDVTYVKDVSETEARKGVRKIRLRPLKFPDSKDTDETDLLSHFLLHRAHLIDAETALQPLILDLLTPFYERSSHIRTWLISTILPLLRMNYEFYPDSEEAFPLELLESMDGQTALNVLLSMSGSHKDSMDLVRNLRGLVGPWIYGSKRSKRRRLNEVAQLGAAPAPSDAVGVEGSFGWEYVNEWLLARGLVDRESVVSAFTHWNGPEDVDLGGYDDENEVAEVDGDRDLLRLRYAQAALASIYADSAAEKRALESSMQILRKMASLLQLDAHLPVVSDGLALPSLGHGADELSSTSRIDLLQNALLQPSNLLTTPSPSSISFLGALLLSLRLLNDLGHPMTCRAAASLCLHSNEEMQLLELRNVIASITRQTRSHRNWAEIRRQLLWLREWQASDSMESTGRSSYHGLFWRVSRDVLEIEILQAFLTVKEYSLAVEIYTNQDTSPLNPSQVEETVKQAIFTAYDNASNGNRTRGGMKRAFDILQAFKSHYPDSVPFGQISALISATHALSFYSLTLQHGVPFQPVNIRIHHDPLSLVEKVLDQNPKSYTKLDDLLSIGRNLVAAGLTVASSSAQGSSLRDDSDLSPEDATLIAERRIISLAISSALSSNDFGTAYSYILTRLTPPSFSPTRTPTAIKDDISWRAVYNAGRYRSTTITHTQPLESQISHLSQRMELLSLALILVPHPDPLPEILGAWRRCDEEMTSLRARESEEADLWDVKGDHLSIVPGGFGPTDSERDVFETRQQHRQRQQQRGVGGPGRSANEAEAPMGLFEVARGAAMALRKNAFPLHAQTQSMAAEAARRLSGEGSRPGSAAGSSLGGMAEEGEGPLGGRVRKRDVVSNMVTGGLASGLGWVLGAQPVNNR